jgi:hypothetical protein
LGDKELSRLSWGAEGLLFRLMSLSATGHIFGYVTDSHGKPYSITEIMETKAAAVLRSKVSLEDTERCLKELLDDGRIKLDKHINAWFIPKMCRIGDSRRQAEKDGRRGGSPLLIAAKRQREWDAAVQHTVDKLWSIEKTMGAKSDDFVRAMSQCGKEYRQLGTNASGKDVIGEALEVIQFRRGHKAKGSEA